MGNLGLDFVVVVVVWGWLLRRLLISIQLFVFWCAGGWFEIHCGCLCSCFQEEYYQKQFWVKMWVAVFVLYRPNHSNKSGGAACLKGGIEFRTISTRWSHVKSTGWELAERKMGRSVGMNMLFHVKN